MNTQNLQFRPANENFYFDYTINNEQLCLHVQFENLEQLNTHLITVKTFDITVKRLSLTDQFKADKVLCDFTKFLRKNNIKKRLFMLK